MEKITIIRKWNNPEIKVSITSEEIAISINLEDFVRALADEVAEPTVKQIAEDAGNVTLLITNAQLQKRMVSSIEGQKVQDIFLKAMKDIIEQAKAETSKVI